MMLAPAVRKEKVQLTPMMLSRLPRAKKQTELMLMMLGPAAHESAADSHDAIFVLQDVEA